MVNLTETGNDVDMRHEDHDGAYNWTNDDGMPDNVIQQNSENAVLGEGRVDTCDDKDDPYPNLLDMY